MDAPKDAKADNRIDISDAGMDLENLEAFEKEAAEGVQEIELELNDDALRFVEQLQAALDEAQAARQRALADFSNYQRRALENEQRARSDGMNAVVQSLLPVLDHFDLTLGQDPEMLTIDKLMDGVQIVRDEFTAALQRHGVNLVMPAIGDEFDPNVHEAMMRQPAEGVAPNHIVMVMQPGYMLGERVLRPAKVAVAPQDEE